MEDINGTNIRLLDGTLILVFLGLMQHRKATTVAAQLGLTQPAISHSLKRLRQLYDDPLFERSGSGLEPTAFAEQIEASFRTAAAELSKTFSDGQAFNPADSRLSLTIAGIDYDLAALSPSVITRAGKTAPFIKIETVNMSPDEALKGLERARVDLVLGTVRAGSARALDETIHRTELFQEEYVIVGRAQSDHFQNATTMQGYAQSNHLFVLPSGIGRGVIDQFLAEHGLERNVQSTVPMFFPALMILEQSDLIATLPRKVAETYAARFGLVFRDLPFPSPRFPVEALITKRNLSSPAHLWLRNIVEDALKG